MRDKGKEDPKTMYGKGGELQDWGRLDPLTQQDALITATAPMIDKVLQHKTPNGFMNPYRIGEANWQYRVYRNL